MPLRRSRGRSADARDDASAEVLLGVLPPAGSGRVLVVDDPSLRVTRALASRGYEPATWNRFAEGAAPGTPWPEPGPYALCALRLPKAKEALDFALAAAASVLEPGGRVLVHGGNDEGIKSAGRRVAERFEDVETLDTRRRCRVLQGRRPEGGVRASVEDFRSLRREDGRVWASWPGLFAGGRLDPATDLLARSLPDDLGGLRVLDFGCGPGRLAAAAAERGPSLLHALDADALAVLACRENVPGAEVFASDGFALLPPGRYDLILSNPPLHRGKAEDHGALLGLLEGAPGRLRPGGELRIVVQRRLKAAELVGAAFPEADIVVEDARFQVLRGRVPA